MPPKNGERTAKSATRFTPTTPHASSKIGSGAAHPRVSGSAERVSSQSPGSGAPSAGVETPEQKVARLRAAHQAAKNAKVSRFDAILARARPFFDSAHRITVVGLVGVTALAGLMTVYTAYDMLQHNRARKIQFDEAQKKMSAESLEAARLAYMRGDATEEQMRMVDELNTKSEGFKMPSILSAPQPIEKTNEVEAAAVGGTTPASSDAQPETAKSGLWGWLSGGPKKEGAKTSSEEKPRTLEEKRALLDKAKAAFEQERENQKNGGPLDRIGTETQTVAATLSKDAEQPKKKGWLW